MYINPIVVGVIGAILGEIVAIAILAAISNRRNK